MLVCTHKNCKLQIYDEATENKCILHCKKDSWQDDYNAIHNNEDNKEFWAEIRKIRNEQNFMMFEGIVFPNTTRFHRVLNGMYGTDAVLEKDFLFWKKGERKETSSLLQFKGCTFYNFDFYALNLGSLVFNNITVKGELGIHLSDIRLIRLVDSKNVNKFRIEKQRKSEFLLSDSSIEKCFFNEVSFDEIKLSKTVLQEVAFNDVEIRQGVFEESSFGLVENFTYFRILNKEKFHYISMDVKNSKTKEYFRFFKHFFNEQKDYVNENDMYSKEMNIHLKEVWRKFNDEYNFNFKYFPDLVVLGFGKISSNFSQSWILALMWIIGITVVFYYVSFDTVKLNGMLEFMNPFNNSYSSSQNKISYTTWFFHKILVSLFIYQLIVTLKRKTRFS